MAAVKALATLVKRYGPNMGRVIHAVAEETGLAASQVSKLLKSAGPLKSKFDFKTIFHHGTPTNTISRRAASRGYDVGKVFPFEKGMSVKNRPKDYERLYAPFEEIAPSRGGALGPGTYLSRDPFWSLQMAVRKADPRVRTVERYYPRPGGQLGQTAYVEEAILNPVGRNEPSIIPYILKKGWKDRLIGKEAFDDVADAKIQLIDNYMMSKYHDIGRFTNPKLYEEIIKPVSLGGRFVRAPGFYNKGEKKTLQAMFNDMVPKDERMGLTKKYKQWLTEELPDSMRRGSSNYDEPALYQDLQKYARGAAQKSLAKEGKIGIYKPASEYWPEEHLIFPGLEKEWVRHPLARFQKEIGGTFASLLPLISLLRGQREE